ncbi:MAG: CheR family methyltransferase [Actinomycetota bacterium]
MLSTKADPRLDAVGFARFRELVAEKSGLELGENHRNNLERAIAQALADTGCRTTDALYCLLADRQRGRVPLESFIASLTIGETHFFRNRPQFEALRDHVLPELIEARRHVRRLRVWSAGCASGEEPYSIAMLIHQLLPNLAAWNVTVLGTDINPRAMDKARRGVYGQWSFREVPPEIEQTYFRHSGSQRELVPEIREMVTFRYLNLVDDVFPSLLTNTVGMDIIFCRNVLIYFRKATIAGVVQRFHRALAPDGWLFVGNAEPPQAIAAPLFTAQNFPGTVAHRRASGSGPGPDAPAEYPEPVEVHEVAAPAAPVVPKVAPKKGAARPSARKAGQVRRQVVHPEPPKREPAQPPEPDGREDGSLERLKSQAEADPKDAVSAYRVAKIHASRLELDAAEYWVGVAIARDPMMAQAHYLHGLIFQERGLPEPALVALRRSVCADPRFALGHFALGTLLRSRGQAARAQKAFDNVAALLEGRDIHELIPDGDGLTIGRLVELVSLQRTTAAATSEVGR